MDEFQAEQLFKVYINAIMQRCADELGVSVDYLRQAYVTNEDVKADLDNIFARHIDALGETA